MRVGDWEMRRFGEVHTVRRPSEIDPTNLSIETVLEAMIPSEISALEYAHNVIVWWSCRWVWL
jgi:hypothetical protein